MQDTACRGIRREIEEGVQAHRSLEAIASSALRHIRQLVPCQQANIVKFDIESQTATVLATDGTNPLTVGTANHLPLKVWALNNGLAYREIAPESGRGKFYLVEDIAALLGPSSSLQMIQSLGVGSYLNVPIIAPLEYGRSPEISPLGCMNLSADTPGAFTAEHVNLACEVANFLAFAIRQTSLHQQMQRHNDELESRFAENPVVETELMLSLQAANERLLQEITSRQQIEAQLQKQNEWSQLIVRISKLLRRSHNLKEILNATVGELRQLLQADRVLIYRFIPQSNSSIVVESLENCRSMLGFRMPEESIYHTKHLQYQQGNIQAIDDIYSADLEPDCRQLLELFNIKSQLVIPLLQESVEIGVLSDEVHEDAFGCFTPHNTQYNTPNSQLWGLLIVHQCSRQRSWQSVEIDWLKTVATQVEIAIGKFQSLEVVNQLSADLASQVADRTAQLQLSLKFEAMLKRITDKVRDSLDESQILQTAVQELAIALEVENCNSAVYSADRTTATIGFEYATTLRSAQEEVVQIADFPQIYTQLLQGQPVQFCELNFQAEGRQMAILASPIFNSSEAIGDLWLFKPKQDVFNDLESRLVQLVASQCAIAIRQARLYQASLTQVKELAKLNILKEDFLSTVSHELATPLTNMKMAIQMLAIALNQETGFFAEFSKPEAQQNKLARYFQIVRNECEREISLIRDILELQQLDADSGRWAPAIVDLYRVIPQIVQPYLEQARIHQQALDLDMASDLPPMVGDPVILKRILSELLTNACKYTPAGEQITVKVRATEERLLLSVTNSGVEIPADELNRIFNKFYRIPKTDRWQQGGTGLGLAVVQKLAERLGGTIKVNSAGGLTCFALELPINGPNQE